MVAAELVCAVEGLDVGEVGVGGGVDADGGGAGGGEEVGFGGGD